MSDKFSVSNLTLRAKFTYASHSFKAIFKQHHKALIPLLTKLIPKDAIVLDVGGHAGQFTKIFAKIATNGHVYSFEPGGYACSILQRSLSFNVKNNATIIQEGLGDKEGILKLNIPMKKNGVFRYGVSHFGDGNKYDHSYIETSKINTIDNFYKKYDLNKLDFIKADIEGWEQRMIIGGEKTIRKYMPIILLEMVDQQLNRAGDNLEGLWQLLKSWGYSPYMHEEDFSTNLVKIDNPKRGDIFWCPNDKNPN